MLYRFIFLPGLEGLHQFLVLFEFSTGWAQGKLPNSVLPISYLIYLQLTGFGQWLFVSIYFIIIFTSNPLKKSVRQLCEWPDAFGRNPHYEKI